MDHHDHTEDLEESGEALPPGASALLRDVARAPQLSLETPAAARGEPDPPFPGTARFRVEATLGAGAFGSVYRVFDRERGLQVALKVSRRREPRWLLRFKEEFRSLAGVVHPNLVTLYDLGGDSQQIFFTMELVEGMDFLAHVLEPPAQAAREERLRRALAQLWRGISFLHASGMVHRDLKPSNVLVTPEGRVVILDFGLISPRGVAGEVVGTPAYMAPEQVAGEAIEASDWYAVGVMLYQALTGALPFEGPSEEVLARKVETEPPRPRRIAPGAPEDLDRIAAGLLRREPQAREAARGELAELAAALGTAAGPEPPAPPPTPSARFVGRREELRSLEEAFAASLQGCAWVHVEGGSGLGKSTLLSHFLATISPDALVLSSRCYERESVPYKTLDGIIDALGGWLRGRPAPERARLWPLGAAALAAIFPSLAPSARDLATPGEESSPRRRLLDATRSLSQLLANLCAERPVVLYVDDVQWGDRDSADLLCAVLATNVHRHLCLVTCARPAGGTPALDALLEHRARLGPSVSLVDIRLGPLAPAEARELAAALIGPGDPRAEALAGESEGNPFLLDALSRLRREGGPPGVGSLDDALRADLALLPERARRLAEAVAVAGQPLPPGLAARAADLPSLEPKTVLQLRSARVLSVRVGGGGEALECYHDRVRESLVASLPSNARRSQHRRLAGVLASAGADPERIGEHHREGGEPREAARCFEVAAERAYQALAFARCARLLDAVATLGERPPAELSRLRERQADAAALAGRAPEAMRAYELAAEQAQGERARSLRALAAEQSWRGGRLGGRSVAMRGALRTVGVSWPRTGAGVVLRLLRRRAQLWWHRFEPRSPPPSVTPEALRARVDTTYFFAGFSLLASPVDGLALHSESLHWALASQSEARIGRGLAIEAAVRSMRGGDPQAAATLLERGAGLAATGDVHCRAQVLAGRAWLHLSQTGFQDADDAARKAGRLYLSEPGTRFLSEVALMRFFRMTALFHLGGFAELQALYTQHVTDCSERDDILWRYVGAAHFGWLGALLAREPESAFALAQEVESLECQVGVSLAHASSLGVRAWANRIAEDGRAAVADLDRVWRDLRRQRLVFLPMFALRARVDRACALLCAAAGERPGSRAWRITLDRVGRDAARIARLDLPAARAAALFLRAALDAVHRPPAAGVEPLTEAETALEALGLRGWAMAARHRRGDIGGKPALLASAENFFREAGAQDPAHLAAVLIPWPAAASGGQSYARSSRLRSPPIPEESRTSPKTTKT